MNNNRIPILRWSHNTKKQFFMAFNGIGTFYLEEKTIELRYEQFINWRNQINWRKTFQSIETAKEFAEEHVFDAEKIKVIK